MNKYSETQSNPQNYLSGLQQEQKVSSEEAGIFLNFIQVQRINTGADAIEIKDGNRGTPLAPVRIKQETVAPSQTPIIHRNVQDPANKRPAATPLNDQRPKRPRLEQSSPPSQPPVLYPAPVNTFPMNFLMGQTLPFQYPFGGPLVNPVNHNGFITQAPRIVTIEERQKEVHMLFNLGLARLKQGNYAGAQEAYEAGLKIEELTDLQKGRLFLSLGLARLKQGNNAGAQKAYEAGLKIGGLTDLQKGGFYFQLAKVHHLEENSGPLSIICNLKALDCFKDRNQADKAVITTRLKSQGSPEEILVKLSSLLTQGSSTIPTKEIWQAIAVLGRMNSI